MKLRKIERGGNKTRVNALFGREKKTCFSNSLMIAHNKKKKKRTRGGTLVAK
jgi:hypothetical protein